MRHSSPTITTQKARRLALARAGLLKPSWTGLPEKAPRKAARAHEAALAVIRRFGYLQLDTVSIAGARSHAIVLMSRLEGIDPTLGETLLQPGAPLFEYWGHEACWLPIELYPLFDFRRRAFRVHPWWGDLLTKHPEVADRLRRRIREEGPLRSVDMEGQSGQGWWDLKLAKKIATAMWSSGELAIRARNNFQRSYDLTERVIPKRWRDKTVDDEEAMSKLLMLAIEGHGWATRTTLAQTWRLRNCTKAIDAALTRLTERGVLIRCDLELDDGKRRAGFVRPVDLELADRLERIRPRTDKGVLLSPFDPVLWDRQRVFELFDFEQKLEIFKPAAQRVYGYYCLPVLVGDRLVGRYDLKADRAKRSLTVLAEHAEANRNLPAARAALRRFADALELETKR